MVDDCDQIDWDEIAVQLNRDKSQCRRHWSFERDCILQELSRDGDEIHLGLPFKSRARREDWKTFLIAVLQQNPSSKDEIDYESAVRQMNKQSNLGLTGSDFIQHWRRKMLLFCNRNKSIIQDGEITFNEFLRNAVSVYEEPPMNPRRLKEKLSGRWLDEEIEDEEEAQI